MQAPAPGLLLQEVLVGEEVIQTEKDRLAPIAALRDVMGKTWNHDPSQTCHEGCLPLYMAGEEVR